MVTKQHIIMTDGVVVYLYNNNSSIISVLIYTHYDVCCCYYYNNEIYLNGFTLAYFIDTTAIPPWYVSLCPLITYIRSNVVANDASCRFKDYSLNNN